MTGFHATLTPDGDGLLVRFADVPEAITGGADWAEALANARDALEVALLTYLADGRSLPEPAATDGVPITVAAEVAVKIAFVEAFRASEMTRVALGRQLGKQESEVRRMLDPYHRTKLAAMEAGLHALGKQLIISVRDAA